MKILRYDEAEFAAELEKLYSRPGYPAEIESQVGRIMDDVRRRGDAAIIEYAAKFDHTALTPARFRVSESELEDAADEVGEAEQKAIRDALANIREFAAKRLPEDWSYSPREGVVLGETFSPVKRVGIYVPGGTAPLVSTVLHTAGIAKVAGVEEIVAITPSRKGEIHPAVLHAMYQAGVTEVYRLGGVYGIAALAYGTSTVKKVDKIVGPGNAYVTAAKKLAYGSAAIDMVAGPSEIMVIADESAKPDFIAADLLSQAEHGSGFEQTVLVTTDPALPGKVQKELKEQLSSLGRSEMAEKVLENGTCLIIVPDLNTAAEIAGNYAPEHLEIMTADPEKVAANVTGAGAIFLGDWTPESLGDFCAGPSHVLPTAGSGRFFSGLRTEEFFRRSSIVKYTREALAKENHIIEQFGLMEGLGAHGRAGSIRLKGLAKK